MQARLVELVGVAADIADARALVIRHKRSSCPVGTTSPLDLFGCVGEGTPADAMAQEALLLWVGITRAPPDCWPPPSPRAGELDGRKMGIGDVVASDGNVARHPTVEKLNAPVLKAIFCASDAIRLRLARSLLSVCGVEGPTVPGSGTASEYAAGGEDVAGRVARVGAKRIEESDVERGGAVTDTVQTDEKLHTEASDLGSGDKKSAGERQAQELLVVDNDTVSHTAPEGVKPLEVACAGDEDGEGKAPVDDVPGHIVRLLLGNIPRAEAVNGGLSGAREMEAFSVPETLLGTALGGKAPPRRDCTELFTVLCALVAKSLKADSSRGHDPTGPPVDIQGLLSDLVTRLNAHPCTERRGAKEADKDTLLVGLLELGITVVEACPESAGPLGKGLVEALLDDFLFAPPTPARYVNTGIRLCADEGAPKECPHRSPL